MNVVLLYIQPNFFSLWLSLLSSLLFGLLEGLLSLTNQLSCPLQNIIPNTQ